MSFDYIFIALHMEINLREEINLISLEIISATREARDIVSRRSCTVQRYKIKWIGNAIKAVDAWSNHN